MCLLGFILTPTSIIHEDVPRQRRKLHLILYKGGENQELWSENIFSVISKNWSGKFRGFSRFFEVFFNQNLDSYDLPQIELPNCINKTHDYQEIR